MPPTPCIIFFVKAPVPGAVKTRLAGHTGGRGALRLYRALVADTLATLRRVNIDLRIFYHPCGHAEQMRDWLGADAALYAQQGADLGERMYNAFRRIADEGFGSMILIGSDIPGLDERIIHAAFSELAEHPVVIGPAADGGYYLAGFRSDALFREAFIGMDWGSGRVLKQTLARFRARGRQVPLLPCLRDIDTWADLRALAENLACDPAARCRLSRTRAVLAEMNLV